ncbi:MAG: DUF973 family protein [Candidatus Aramenus sp.]|jgi:hypothetical protein|nr:DUF973 family protein [Candidatus Aramenus sp.]
MSYQSIEIEGIKKIRSGMLIYIVGNLLSVFLAFSIVGLLFGTLGALSSANLLAGLGAVAGLVIAAGLLLLVGAVLDVISILRVRDGLGMLVSVGRDVGIGRTGTTLILVGAALSIITALLTFVVIGIFLVPIAEVILLIGVILLGIGLYEVGSIYQDTLTEVGGIVSIFVGFIGAILVYVGLGKVLQKLSAYATAGPTVTAQSVIRGNGIATLTFYSQYQGTILSVQILGTNYITAVAMPSTVAVGNNAITVNFNGPVSLSSGMTYTVRVNLSNGAYIDVQAVYTP